ncbi:UDP-glycosyltransferase 91D2-like [Nicotiana tabacum]|uniref:Glycosyltransferase n=2 Tax=Nicotiana TaxID=4085 RepID=A0A1S3ZCZ9_TOBAC|nr:PREDICTED: putative UDP-rhamnose:rhamnosyltransferase 1 [Nicotiana sylvestris]XP_016462278.1 PREDICTED: UDP-glycosyltransferase 91D1-like [Nicotiana tabacum]WIW42722.1 UDP-glycosyltransferase [Nicotiana tabacum]
MDSQLLIKSMANGDEGNTDKLHVVMFPWLAFGHIIPFLELSKFIAQKGHKISFISTPKNIDRLPKLPLEFSNSITFVKIPLPKVDGLPENAEATMDITTEEIIYLKKAMDGMEKEVTKFLEKNSPDWIIQDFAQYWLAPISAKLGISRIFYCIINAWFIAFFGSTENMVNTNSGTPPTVEDFLVPPKWIPFETKAAYRRHEARWMVGSSQKNVSGVSDLYRNGVTMTGADATIFRHCYEFEGQWLKLLEDLHNIPMIPSGLMPPMVKNIDDEKNNQSWMSIKEWLDEKPKGSVVYVALGSEVTIGLNDINELALGLELSRSPFFWVLRKPSKSGNTDPIELPEGFEERIKGRGIVWKSWAPQLNILSHDSVGGFLTHCGWSSIIEGLMFGHPLIMLPFLVDQGLNARILEDKGVGVEIPRNEEDGSYTSDSVANSVNLVMVENEGKIIREKAKEMISIFGNKNLHDKYIENLIEFLENHRKVSNQHISN